MLLSCLFSLGLLQATAGSSEPEVRLGMACDPKNVECDQPSLGRQVALGHGWDVRGDRSLISSPWMSDTIANKKIDTENNYKEMHLSMETDSSERADSMSVEANLEVNVLSGLVQVSAGGKYMTSEKETSNSVRVVLKYEATNYFTMMPYSQTPVDQSNLDFCSNDNLAKEGGPTHVVSSVQFGTTAFVLFEREVFRGESEEEVSGYLSVNVANAVAGYGVNSSLNVNYTGSLNTTRDTINIHFLGNSLINVPQSLEDISKLIDDLDESTRTNPQPLRFTMARIDEICSAADVVFASIGNPTLERLADILRSFADSELRTKTFLHEENSVARRQSLRQALEGPGSFGGELNSFQGDFKMELSKLLVDVRSNATNDVALESIILDVDESYFEEYKARTFLDYFDGQIHSFDGFYDTPDAPNIQVDKADGSLQSACVLGGAKNTYIFTLNVLPDTNLATEFFAGTLDTSKNWISDQADVGLKFRQFRLKAAETNPDSSCFIVDFAVRDPNHQVTFKVVDIFGHTQESHDNLPEVEDHQITLDHNSCHWVNADGWGQVIRCQDDELAAGACAGGSHYDCKSGAATHSLYCCHVSEQFPIKVDEDNCRELHSSYGYSVDCSAQSSNGLTVHRSCSSGAYHDCWLSGGGEDWDHGNGDWDTNRVDCCSTTFNNGIALGMRGEDDCGDWHYGDWGVDLWCPDNSVLVARCGSGRQHDCPHSSSHGIKCCSLYALL